MKTTELKKMVITALFMALTCVGTMVIRIPSLGPSGYVNIGDTFVLLSTWVLGGWYGALAAGMGSAFADLLAGYGAYVPGTFFIKFLMSLGAYFLYKLLSKVKFAKAVNYILSALGAECIMIVGYLFYEAICLQYGVAAVPAVASNAVQGITNIIIAVVAIYALSGVKLLDYMKN